MNVENQNILSIRLNADSFKYAVIDTVKEAKSDTTVWKTDVSLSLTANLREFFKEHEELCDCQQVVVKLETTRYVIVPNELFDEKQADLFFCHNLTKQENETVLFDECSKLGIAVVYGIDTNAYHLLLAQFSNIRFVSLISSLISCLAEKSRQGDNRKMFVRLGDSVVDVLCFDFGKLLLANSYTCRETSDRFYYIMYAWLQIGLNQELDDILLMGASSDKANLLAMIDKYIRHRFVLSAEEEENINDLLE